MTDFTTKKTRTINQEFKPMLSRERWQIAEELMESQRRQNLSALSVEEALSNFSALTAFSYAQAGQSEAWDRMIKLRLSAKLAARIELISKLSK